MSELFDAEKPGQFVGWAFAIGLGTPLTFDYLVRFVSPFGAIAQIGVLFLTIGVMLHVAYLPFRNSELAEIGGDSR